VASAFVQSFGEAPEHIAFAPGRATLLGAHIDHQGGRVLAGALELGIACAVGPARGREHQILALDRAEWDRLDGLATRSELEGSWRDYVRAMLAELAEGVGAPLPPQRLVFGGDLPVGAGLSSSAALELAICRALEAQLGLDLGPLGRAELGRRVENERLGLRSGPMDQLVSACAEPGRLLGLDLLALGAGAAEAAVATLAPARELGVVLLDSGVRRRLVASAFNDRRAECEAALAHLRALSATSGASWRELGARVEIDEWLAQLDVTLARRARHVLAEDRRAVAAIAELEAGRFECLPALMAASQASSRDLWESSLPELDFLAEVASATPGCLGARFGGGGFGGWVVAVVERDSDAAAAIAMQAREAFSRYFGREAVTLRSALGAGARLV
jgi:galactokinase